MEKLNVYNYSISNSGERLVINIDGAIVDAETQQILKDWWGDETSVSFKSIRDQVNKSGNKNIDFVMNSYGGHVGDAMAIHDWIKMLMSDATYNVRTFGLGMVCSATTYVLSAGGDQSYISPNSWYMIHNVSGGIRGDVNVIENYARTMRKFNDKIVEFYVNLTGKTTKQISDWMDAETWFTGDEAVANGFVKNSTEKANFTNAIAPEMFPYKNTAALNLYNSFVKAVPTNEKFNLNINNVNEFVQAIIDAFKAENFFGNKDGSKPTPLTEENMTNALNKAFEGLDISNMVNTALNDMFKDGLPEALQNALTTSVGTTMDEKLKNFTKSDDIKDFVKKDDIKDFATKQELTDLEEEIANNAGPARPKNKKDNTPEDQFDHEGVSFGDK